MSDNVAYELQERRSDEPAGDDGIRADEVIDYLQHHPELLLDHPELLDRLELPGPPEPAVSLHHWQLRRWRARANRHSEALDRLHRVAEENAAADRLLHGFCQALLAADRRDTDTLARLIDRSFDVDAVRAIRLDELDATARDALSGWLANPAPRCGRPGDAVHRALFDEHLAETGSAALIAVRGDQPETITHVLALGRHAPDGFNPAQGTHFLEQIGELAGAFLAGQTAETAVPDARP